MQFNVEIGWIVGVVLVAIRVSPLFILAPVFGTLQLPSRVRLLLVLALSATLASMLGTTKFTSAFLQPGELLLAGLGEILIGALFSFGLFAAFAVFLFGGRLLDMQIGFGIASLIDPGTRNQSPLIGTALNLLAVFIFFTIDGHHMILRALALSLEKIPPGTFHGNFELAPVVALFGAMFSFGLAVVAPVVFMLFLIDVSLAVISRTMPQLNIFFLGISIKLIVSLVMLATSLQYMAPLMSHVFNALFTYWNDVLG